MKEALLHVDRLLGRDLHAVAGDVREVDALLTRTSRSGGRRGRRGGCGAADAGTGRSEISIFIRFGTLLFEELLVKVFFVR